MSTVGGMALRVRSVDAGHQLAAGGLGGWPLVEASWTHGYCTVWVRLLVGAATRRRGDHEAAEDHPDVSDDVSQHRGAPRDAISAEPGRAGDQGRQHAGIIFPPEGRETGLGNLRRGLPPTGNSAGPRPHRPRVSRTNAGPRGASRCTRCPMLPKPPNPRPGPVRSRRSGAGKAVPQPEVAEELDYPSADAGPAARPAAIAGRQRTRSPAGLRAGHQGPCTIPDVTRQQDHPREREVIRAAAFSPPNSAENPFRCARWRSGWRAGSTSWARSG